MNENETQEIGVRLDNFFELCSYRLEEAKEKHPLFAHRLADKTANDYNEKAKKLRKKIKGSVNKPVPVFATDVIQCEVEEFFEELANGNLLRAADEAADVVATILRSLEFLDKHNKAVIALNRLTGGNL